ncbi:phage terminase small subunit P27 family [Enterococcus casseliflavus]|uniref:phage terminase small subunit P27 family n=1 Tax=Enterococcus casseliflavus TaxID=37734 RepID=UPI0014333912|nr:phage terminase small subunit P27 family [Enterococcus casseliflavus]NKD37885.1 phage terminase small subunit P27 family [Enterococcus casseliflavus]
MGRKTTLLNASSKHYTKEELEIKQEQEEILYTFEPLNFKKYPKNLDKLARNEWKRLATIVDSRNLPISELDRAIVTNYCMYVSISERAREQINQEPLTIDGKKNQIIDVLNGANKELKSLASQLGLTIDSRMRIKNPTTENENNDDPFADMLKQADNNA